jgi:hypothetical protein
MISSWVWNFSIEWFLHFPISGNTQQGSVADPVIAGLKYWSSYKGKASSEIMAELQVLGS